MKTPAELLKTIKRGIAFAQERVDQKMDDLYPKAEGYIKTLLKIATLAFFAPVLVAAFGTITGWSIFTAIAGLISSFFLAILFVLGAPIGAFLDTVLPGKNGKWYFITGDRYLKVAREMLLWQTLTYWLLTIIPIRDNWTFIPLFELTILALFLMSSHWKIKGTWLKPILWWTAICIVCLCMMKFFFPHWTFKDDVGVAHYTWTPLSVLVALGSLAAVALLVRKLGNSASGHHNAHPPAKGDQGGHGEHHDKPSVFAIAARLVAIILVTCFLLTLVQIALTPALWDQIPFVGRGRGFVQAADASGTRKYKIEPYGLTVIALGEGPTPFSYGPNQVVQVDLPLYPNDLTIYRNAGEIWVKKYGESTYSFSPGPNYGTNTASMQFRTKDQPVEVTIHLKRK